MMGSFRGGALWLADGRRFTQKWKWYQYDGAKIAHGVEPFVGERLSVVLYSMARKWKTYVLDGGTPKPQSVEETPQSHPKVEQLESPRTMHERERRLQIQAEKAKIEWRQAAANKLWNLVRAPMDVCKHCGEHLDQDPRLEQSYKDAVKKGP